MSHEQRFIPIEVETRDGEAGMTLTSHAPPWESLSVDLGGFREQFKRGAFVNLGDGDILATFNHDSSAMLGRTSSKTLRVKEDDEGLRYEVDLPDTTLGTDLAKLVRRKDIRGSSFEFTVEPGGESWEKDKAGTMVRTVTKARLYQVGPVTSPAYQDTAIAQRSLEAVLADEDEELIDTAKLDRAKRRLRLAEAE